jgi:hypothetical protein
MRGGGSHCERARILRMQDAVVSREQVICVTACRVTGIDRSFFFQAPVAQIADSICRATKWVIVPGDADEYGRVHHACSRRSRTVHKAPRGPNKLSPQQDLDLT